MMTNDLIKYANTIAKNNNLSIYVDNIYKTDDMYKVQVSIGLTTLLGTDSLNHPVTRYVKKYYYINSKLEAEAVMGATTLAILDFVGVYPEEALEFIKLANPTKEAKELEEAKVEAPKEAKPRINRAKKSTEAKSEEGKVEEVKVEAPKEVKPVEVKFKGTVYNNLAKEHTSHLGKFLTDLYGDEWKKKSGVKDFSASLAGKQYLDEKGNVMDSFKSNLTSFFGK